MICKNCKKRPPREGRKLCEYCTTNYVAKGNQKQSERIKNGLCFRCGKQPENPSRACRACALKVIASDNLKDIKRASEIGELLDKQQSRCVYTGLSLILGRNASLDHIVPRCKGGTDDLSNLQWIETGINRLKRDLDDAEFREYLQNLSASLNEHLAGVRQK